MSVEGEQVKLKELAFTEVRGQLRCAVSFSGDLPPLRLILTEIRSHRRYMLLAPCHGGQLLYSDEVLIKGEIVPFFYYCEECNRVTPYPDSLKKKIHWNSSQTTREERALQENAVIAQLESWISTTTDPLTATLLATDVHTRIQECWSNDEIKDYLFHSLEFKAISYNF